MNEYLLYRIASKERGSIYTIHAPRYRCHVGEFLDSVFAETIGEAIELFSENFFDYPEFKRCSCLDARNRK